MRCIIHKKGKWDEKYKNYNHRLCNISRNGAN